MTPYDRDALIVGSLTATAIGVCLALLAWAAHGLIDLAIRRQGTYGVPD